VEHDGIRIIYSDRPSWDFPHLARFGDKPLMYRMLQKAMDGVQEPITNVWFAIMLFTVLSFTTPLVSEMLPPIPNDLSTYFPGSVGGIPWWAFKILMVSLVTYIMNSVMICQVPDEYPTKDEEMICKDGIDVNLVELTLPEMGRRTSYDARNELIAARRSTISKAMTDLGLCIDENTNSDASGGTDDAPEISLARRRLSALVLGKESKSRAEDDLKTSESALECDRGED
jgi:hypothetical protein